MQHTSLGEQNFMFRTSLSLSMLNDLSELMRNTLVFIFFMACVTGKTVASKREELVELVEHFNVSVLQKRIFLGYFEIFYASLI